jgi:hypothetical protein
MSDRASLLFGAQNFVEKNALRRIQARAIRREGELIEQVEPATGAHLKRDGDGTLSRKQFAADARLSDRQRVTALRVAIGWPMPRTIPPPAKDGRVADQCRFARHEAPAEPRAIKKKGRIPMGVSNHFVRTPRPLWAVARAAAKLTKKLGT